jgi:hypothetical protein
MSWPRGDSLFLGKAACRDRDNPLRLATLFQPAILWTKAGIGITLVMVGSVIIGSRP